MAIMYRALAHRLRWILGISMHALVVGDRLSAIIRANAIAGHVRGEEE